MKLSLLNLMVNFLKVFILNLNISTNLLCYIHFLLLVIRIILKLMIKFKIMTFIDFMTIRILLNIFHKILNILLFLFFDMRLFSLSFDLVSI